MGFKYNIVKYLSSYDNVLFKLRKAEDSGNWKIAFLTQGPPDSLSKIENVTLFEPAWWYLQN